MINKKASHVGVVLSFILFVTFVIFMYVLIHSKINQERDKAIVLDYVKGEILSRISDELTTISVLLNNPGSNCVELVNFISRTGISNRFIVTDDLGNVLDSGISGQNIKVTRNGATFLKIYESQEFPQKADLSGSCQSQDYTIGLSKKEKLVFESKVTDFLNNYTTNYEDLKKSLNIGSRDEFGLMFTYNNGTIIKTPIENITMNIYANQIPIQYTKNNGAREAGFVNVLVW